MPLDIRWGNYCCGPVLATHIRGKKVVDSNSISACHQVNLAAQPAAEHASGLTTQLHAAAADIALLFQRVDEKNSLEDSNMALVQVCKLLVTSMPCRLVPGL